MFRNGFAKVDRDVAYVAMVMHVCFKCMFKMFHLYQTYVASVFSDIAKVDLDVAYTYMLQAYISSIFKYFIHMFTSVSSGCCICL